MSKFRNDEWVLADDYALGGASDTVARIALEADAPFTFAVTGKWGAGKTSVLRRAFATLGGLPISQALPLGENKQEKSGDAEKWKALAFSHEARKTQLNWGELAHVASESLCIWYSPWQHQSERNPLIPLLLEIQNQFSLRHKVVEGAKEFNRRGGLAALTLIGRVIDHAAPLFRVAGVESGGKVADTVDAVRKSWRDAAPNLTELSDGQRFHLLFEDAVETVLAGLISFEKELSDSARLIIFIDDLDRCEEQTVVTLLEAIKLYLGTRRCVFVLGMDDAAVLGALRRHWTDRSEDDNREYLEKLLQATLPVPLPRPAKITAAIAAQLEAHSFPAAEACAEQISHLLEPNPRKLKNFVNSLCIVWELFGLKVEAKEEAAAIKFIMFHYLRLYHRTIWRLLERQPTALPILWRVLKGTETEPVPDSDLVMDDQRMLRAFFSQAFAHVLKDVGSDEAKHRGESLDKAIDRFQQRQDRKRSDEYFVRWFLQQASDADLADAYLYLPE